METEPCPKAGHRTTFTRSSISKVWSTRKTRIVLCPVFTAEMRREFELVSDHFLVRDTFSVSVARSQTWVQRIKLWVKSPFVLLQLATTTTSYVRCSFKLNSIHFKAFVFLQLVRKTLVWWNGKSRILVTISNSIKFPFSLYFQRIKSRTRTSWCTLVSSSRSSSSSPSWSSSSSCWGAGRCRMVCTASPISSQVSSTVQHHTL